MGVKTLLQFGGIVVICNLARKAGEEDGYKGKEPKSESALKAWLLSLVVGEDINLSHHQQVQNEYSIGYSKGVKLRKELYSDR